MPKRQSERISKIQKGKADGPTPVPSPYAVSSAVIPDIAPSSSNNIKTKKLKREEIVPEKAESSSSSASKALLVKGDLTAVASAARPTPEECLYATVELGKLHPEVIDSNEERRKKATKGCGMRDAVADGVVETILSQNTTSANSTRAFANLKKAFPTWESLLEEPDPSKLEEAIRCGGLAKIKSGRIYKMFQTIQNERGSPSLEYLRDMSDDAVKEELNRFPGMGPKTISCVMLFAMARPEFPVDTHVHRITKQMNWIGSSASREDAYDYLNEKIPAELKLDLHCLLIAHGKQCHRCAARGKPQFPPKDGSKLKCPLVNSGKKMKAGATIVVKKEIILKAEPK